MLYPNGEISLGLSKPVKLHKPPQSLSSRERGGKPQTTYSKRMVRNCIAKLEREHGKQNLAFATYTLPDLPEDELDFLNQESGTIASRLKQEIEREQVRAGIQPGVVWIIEIQEERYKKSGAIAFHIHAVFQSRKTRSHGYAISKGRNTEIWNRMISNALGRRVEIPWGANIQQIKKSAEYYMSKYMSKGGKLAQEVSSNGQKNSLPKNWWGASWSLRRWVKANVRLLSDASIDFIKSNYKQFQKDLKNSPFSWLHVPTIELEEPHGEIREYPVAIVGKLRRSWMDSFEFKSLSDVPMSWEW